MRAVIFANGVIESWPTDFTLDPRYDLIIAADGGSRLCRQWKLAPHVVIGDLDSSDPGELSRLEQRGTEIIRLPARKDHTDLELALELACRRGADDIVVLGALGRRWDMTLANVMLLTADFLSGKTVKILDGREVLFLLKGGTGITLKAKPGDGVSLVPLTARASGITLDGFSYPLKNEELQKGATRGISNIIQSATPCMALQEGILLVIHHRQ